MYYIWGLPDNGDPTGPEMYMLNCFVLFMVISSHGPKPSTDVRNRLKVHLNDNPGHSGKPLFAAVVHTTTVHGFFSLPPKA